MGVTVIGMAELGVVKVPDKITTLGLGSCIGLTMYDKVNKIGGMIHVVLPDSTKVSGAPNKAKFADTGVPALLDAMLRKGASRPNIVAKLAGGAHMFGQANGGKSDILKVGERNAGACITALLKLKIPITARDIGGQYGRTIELSCEEGALRIKTVGRGEKFI